MKLKLSDYFSMEFIKFLCCNGFAAVVNFCSRIVINHFTTYITAVVIAYCCGMVTAFVLNKIFVFRGSKHNTGRQFTGFVIVNLFAVAQTVLFSMLFHSYIFPKIGFAFYPDEAAHFIGISIPIFTSFLGHKHFSFGGEKKDEI